jgi:hypothetical protein
VTQPAPGTRIYISSTTIAGRTEAGADMVITDAGGHPIDAAVAPDGHFSANLTLDVGGNEIVMRSTDAAGNEATERVTIQRASSDATLQLGVTPSEVFATDLPATIELVAIVRDEQGRPIDGQEVVFSVSPPDRETMTYRVTTVNGRAKFGDLVIDPGEADGAWLVTALAALPSGVELRDDGALSVQAGDAPKSPGRR